MKTLRPGDYLAILVLATIALVSLWPGCKTIPGTNVPVEVATLGDRFVEAFRQSDNLAEARDDAATLAALCRSLADMIEYDLQQDRPRLTTGLKLDRFRRWTREFTLRGNSFSRKYPKVADVVSEFLTAELGTEAGPLSKEQREKWVHAFRAMADALEYAVARI